jgi:hypothetical protein
LSVTITSPGVGPEALLVLRLDSTAVSMAIRFSVLLRVSG